MVSRIKFQTWHITNCTLIPFIPTECQNPRAGDPPVGTSIILFVVQSTTTANEFYKRLADVLAEQQRTSIETLNRALFEQQEPFLQHFNES